MEKRISIIIVFIFLLVFSRNVYSDNCSDLLKKVWDYKQSGNLTAAEKECLEVIKLHPNCADAYFLLGRIYGAMEHYDESIVNFEKALKFDPKNAKCLEYLIGIYTYKDKYNHKIVDFFNQLKQIDYLKWRELKTMVIFSRWKGIEEEEEGLTLTVPIQEMASEDAKGLEEFIQRINSLLGQNKIDIAIKEIKDKLSEREEPFLYVYLFKIYSQYLLSETDEMISCLENAIRLIPKEKPSLRDFLRDSLCGVYLTSNDFENIYKQVEKISNTVMRERLYSCYKGIEEYKSGNVSEAMKIWDRVKKEDYVLFRLVVGDYYRDTEKPYFDFDGRNWKIGYKKANSQKSFTEYVLEGETVHNWSELITVQEFAGLQERRTSEECMEFMKEEIAKLCSQVEWNVLNKNDKDITYEWKITNCLGQDDQHEIARIISGKEGIWVVHYATKKTPVSTERRQEWIKILNSVTLLESSQENIEATLTKEGGLGQ